MVRNRRQQSLGYLLVGLAVLLGIIWSAAYFEIRRDYQESLHDAQTQSRLKAQVYAENVRSTIKRLNELLLHVRSNWTGDWKRFAELVRDRQLHIADLSFQIAIIDANGLLAFSNLALPTTRTDLSDREHFRVHVEAGSDYDSLFISRPVLGRVSGKWSIQFTRPIIHGGEFKGVIVASISPETLSSFHSHLDLSEAGASSILRDSGEVLARYPGTADFIGKKVEWPFSDGNASSSGHFRYVEKLDGVERMFGYYKIPEYGMAFFAAEAMSHLLAPHRGYRQNVINYASIISLLALALFALLARNIHAREKSEARLDASERQQRLLGKAIEQSNASVVITNKEGAIVFVNPAFERVTGYTHDEAIGKNPRILKSGLNPPSIYQQLWAALTAGRAWQGELQNRRKSGEYYWEMATISPVIDDTGAVTHYLAVKEDITLRKRQEAELRIAKEDAEAANIAKSQFLATMSHEIRTPMNGILGMAQLLLMPGLSDTEREEFARTIIKSGHILQTLLNDILDLSKVEAGKLTLMPALFDPLQMIEEVVALFGDPAERKGLVIKAHWKSAAAHYRADPIRLRQMLSNLVSNAIKFTERGSVAIEGEALTGEDGRTRLRFEVIDTGIGIPAEKQEQLFRPFVQVDASSTRRFEGTGLGLSIVRKLAELMGGTVGVVSEAGQGSRFWFEIETELATEQIDVEISAATERAARPLPTVA